MIIEEPKSRHERVVRLTDEEIAVYRARFQARSGVERRFDWNNILLFYPVHADAEGYSDWAADQRVRMRESGVVRDERPFGRTLPGWLPNDMPRCPSDHSGFYPDDVPKPAPAPRASAVVLPFPRRQGQQQD